MSLPLFIRPSSKKPLQAFARAVHDAVLSVWRNPAHLSNYQYPALVVIGVLDFFMISPIPLVYRAAMYLALIVVCILPITRHFFVPALPIFAWLFTFFGCRYLPVEARPSHIFVNVLGSLERVLYGANLSTALSAHQHWILDILAWFPYGVVHFAIPFVSSAVLFWFGPPGTLPVFAHAFGYMNFAGVITQLLVPTAPPWYEDLHGTQPATYAMPGSPAGLARMDAILGFPMYSSTFGNSPLVFGAFPSLHSGTASLQALFWMWLFPRAWPVFAVYVLWIWWATMYLSHHYLIDLVGGSMYAILAFFLARRWLPRKLEGAPDRWAYPLCGGSVLGVLRGERKSMRIHLEAFLHDEGECDEEIGLLAAAEEAFVLEEAGSEGDVDDSSSEGDSGMGLSFAESNDEEV